MRCRNECRRNTYEKHVDKLANAMEKFKTLEDAEIDAESHAKLVMLCNCDLGCMMLQSVEMCSAATTARALLELEQLCLSGPARTVPIALRDLYVLQVGNGLRLDARAFEASMQDNFGKSLSRSLRAQQFLAKHHLDTGKFATHFKRQRPARKKRE